LTAVWPAGSIAARAVSPRVFVVRLLVRRVPTCAEPTARSIRTSEEFAMRTFSPRPIDVQPVWYVVDAQDEILGRLATRIAHVLRGKHKPTFAPHMDMGDFVIVVNAAGIRLTGAKGDQKLAYRHSGFPGGLKSVPFARLLAEKPEHLMERAVGGMLPKNTIGRAQVRKLKVYAGPDHPHAAQQPVALP
jgi:large subunit ribosomal protein L13